MLSYFDKQVYKKCKVKANTNVQEHMQAISYQRYACILLHSLYGEAGKLGSVC